jgi:hypothetical protein
VNKPYEADLEQLLREPWPTNLSIAPCSCGLRVHAEVCKQGRGCPLNEPTTEPGELAELREAKPPAGTGIVRVVLVTVLTVLAVVYVVSAIAGWIK